MLVQKHKIDYIKRSVGRGMSARIMPSHRSAEKAVRQTAKRTAINKSRMSRIKTFVKKVEKAVLGVGRDPSCTPGTVRGALVAAERELVRGAQHGVMHKNTAARKVSRLTLKVKKALGEVKA